MIEVDIYEKNEEIRLELETLTEVRLASLHSGDYVFKTWDNKSVGIERKTNTDLLSTISGQRLITQVKKLVENHEYAILLLAGPIACTKNNLARAGNHRGSLPYKYVLSQLHEVSMIGVTIMPIYSDNQSAMTIFQLYEWFQKEEHQGLLSTPKIKIPKQEDIDKLRFLMSLPGIGLKKAELILSTYATPSDFISEVIHDEDTVLTAKERIKIRDVIA